MLISGCRKTTVVEIYDPVFIKFISYNKYFYLVKKTDKTPVFIQAMRYLTYIY